MNLLRLAQTGGLCGLLVILAACSGVPERNTQAPTVDVDFGPEPLVVVDGFSGHLWNGTPNLEQTVFVLYGDGTVIARRRNGECTFYVTSRLERDDVARFLEELNRPALEALDGQSFTAVSATDVGSESLLTRRDDGTYSRVALWGWWSDSDAPTRGPGNVPESVNRAFRAISRRTPPDSCVWQPAEYEVYFQDHLGSDRTPIAAWPSDWPRPDEKRSSRDDLWQSVRLTNPDPAAVASTLGTPFDYNASAVRIGSRVLAARYRPVFPYEERWRRTWSPRRIPAD